jgi:methyl-accepting chemotaxis protein
MLNLNLKKRILLGYLIPIPLSLLIAALVSSTAKTVDASSKDISFHRDTLSKIDSITVHSQRIERSTRGYLINREPRHVEGFQEGKRSFIDAYEVLERQELIKQPELRAILEKIVKSGNQLIELDETMINLAKAGKVSEAIQIFSSDKSSELVRSIYDLNLEFNKKTQEIIQKKQSSLNDAMGFLNAIAVIGTALSAIAAVAFGLFIASRLVQRINQSTNNIVASSTEIAATVEQHERTAAQQAVAVNQTTTTIDELGASSRTCAEQAEAAAASTRQVLALVYGNNDISDAFKESSLREKVEQIAEQILRLSEQTNQIGAISTLVSDLANQTNMLALNAAVEAVRAGDHGKGFGVVAAEIRKLADESKKSAERINSLVKDIEKATHSTVMVTDSGRKTVDEVVAAIDNVAVNAQQIALTAKQQAVAIQQVVDSMNSINQAAAQTASGISQTKVGTQKLNEAAQDLKAVV